MSDKRSKNFSPFERNLLIDLVLQRREVIENKRTDGATAAKKKQSWEDLCKVFNASSQTGERTPKQLKELYFVLKRKAKQNNNEDLIGGGTHDPKSDYIEGKIVGSTRSQFEHDENPSDSSTVLYCDVIPTSEDISQPEATSSSPEVHTVSIEGTSNVEPVIVEDIENFMINGNDVLPASGKANYLERISEIVVNRKKTKCVGEEVVKQTTLLDEELLMRRKEFEMKEIQHQKRCEILDIEKKIKLIECEKLQYELKMKELDYKIKLKQFEML